MAFLSSQQISEMGFMSVGYNVLLSDRASFYGCDKISIGNNVRIDDFCVLSAGVGGIEIGDYIHVAVYTSLIGAGKISIQSYSNISSKVAIYSSNDDYSGTYMTNPMVPEEFTDVTHEDVSIGKHVIVGSGSVILPGVCLEEGVAIGALSLVNNSCDAFGVYSGVPVKKLKNRKTNLKILEQQLNGA